MEWKSMTSFAGCCQMLGLVEVSVWWALVGAVGAGRYSNNIDDAMRFSK